MMWFVNLHFYAQLIRCMKDFSRKLLTISNTHFASCFVKEKRSALLDVSSELCIGLSRRIRFSGLTWPIYPRTDVAMLSGFHCIMCYCGVRIKNTSKFGIMHGLLLLYYGVVEESMHYVICGLLVKLSKISSFFITKISLHRPIQKEADRQCILSSHFAKSCSS